MHEYQLATLASLMSTSTKFSRPKKVLPVATYGSAGDWFGQLAMYWLGQLAIGWVSWQLVGPTGDWKLEIIVNWRSMLFKTGVSKTAAELPTSHVCRALTHIYVHLHSVLLRRQKHADACCCNECDLISSCDPHYLLVCQSHSLITYLRKPFDRRLRTKLIFSTSSSDPILNALNMSKLPRLGVCQIANRRCLPRVGTRRMRQRVSIFVR